MTRITVAVLLLLVGCRRLMQPQHDQGDCLEVGGTIMRDEPECDRVLRCDGEGPGFACRVHKECTKPWHCAFPSLPAEAP